MRSIRKLKENRECNTLQWFLNHLNPQELSKDCFPTIFRSIRTIKISFIENNKIYLLVARHVAYQIFCVVWNKKRKIAILHLLLSNVFHLCFCKTVFWCTKYIIISQLISKYRNVYVNTIAYLMTRQCRKALNTILNAMSSIQQVCKSDYADKISIYSIA